MFVDNEMIEKFQKYFERKPSFYFDAGGRLEICGNHTDHNHGLCLVGNCSLRIKALVSKTNRYILIKSKGYSVFKIDTFKLQTRNLIHGTPKSLVTGILVGLRDKGYKIGGFTAYIESDIPNGGGVSSSAALESLIGYIESYLFNNKKVPEIDIAKIGQFSENNFFGKPCGLLDQVGTSFRGCNFIDFKNINNPIIKTVSFKLPLSIYLISSLGTHSNLTNLYAAIPNSMFSIAEKLEGKKYLRDCNAKDVFERIDALDATTKAKNKAKHFFIENKNVKKAYSSVENNDVEGFLEALRSSQNSSHTNLENTFVKGEYEGSPQDIIDKVSDFLKDKGAVRVHGGGFKGTVLVFVKNKYHDEFETFLKKNYPKRRYCKVSITDKPVNYKIL